MKTYRRLLAMILTAILILALLPSATLAMDDKQQMEFNHVMSMKMVELTGAAFDAFAEDFADTGWDRYELPDYARAEKRIEAGYRIAIKRPELLSAIPCYCQCDLTGHSNLLHCFIKDGEISEGYDEHGAGCTICYGQAMLGYLWSRIGATEAEILRGMEIKFERLLRQQNRR